MFCNYSYKVIKITLFFIFLFKISNFIKWSRELEYLVQYLLVRLLQTKAIIYYNILIALPLLLPLLYLYLYLIANIIQVTTVNILNQSDSPSTLTLILDCEMSNECIKLIMICFFIFILMSVITHKLSPTYFFSKNTSIFYFHVFSSNEVNLAGILVVENKVVFKGVGKI